MAKNKKLNLLALILVFSTLIQNIILANNQNIEINGFIKIKSEFISDYQTNADTYEHIKTGAKVLVINNGDEEKFFTIGFKTPPTNNSGATHVFEHTTLQGSKNYPIKSMLTALGSTSMATYFNAATSDDFTFYPFGSLNEKDYYNLMNIYLDGIFYPMALTDENVFKRDGIRLDLKDNILSYNGVVYNEMKNSSANVNSILYNSIKQSLYPDTYYKYVSGGIPEAIVDLTYLDILKLHEEAYHPANSLTVLYGEQDLVKSFEILNNYFKDYDKKEITFESGYQQPFTELKKYYSTYPVENELESGIMALNYVMPEADYEKTIINIILMDLLMSGDTAPLKKAIAESGITNSLGAATNNLQVNQGALSFYSMNINPEYEDKFIEVIETSLKDIKNNGFDEDYINAIFNSYEYSQYDLKNKNNIGYEASISAISGWIYDDDPTIMMDNKAIFSKLKSQLNSKVFEKAIDDVFLNNKFKSLVVIKPDKAYNIKKSQIITDKLNTTFTSLTQQQIIELKQQTEEFYKWQNTPDSAEDLSKLPSLNISDINTKQKTIKCSDVKDIDGVKFIQTYIDTNGISNISLSFDASTIPQNKLQYLQLMSTLLGNTATKEYTKEELALATLNTLGSFATNLEAVTNENKEGYTPRYNINIKSLTTNEKDALLLVKEILNNSNFDDKEVVRKNLQQIKISFEQSLSELSVPIASYLSAAMISEEGKFYDYISGYEFYNFVSDLLSRLDKDWKGILKELNSTRDLIFNKNGLVIGYTNIEDRKLDYKPLIKSLETKKNKEQKLKFESYPNIIGVIAPTTTLSIHQVGNIKDLGYTYSGNMDVLSKMISKNYLWGLIREQGGAYHAGMHISHDGFVKLVSYADPNFANTINVYKNIPSFIENIKTYDQSTIDKFIISSASTIDNLLRDYNLWDYGTRNYITGYGLDKLYKQKQEILNTKLTDIINYSDMFKKLNKNAKYVIIGNSQIIYKNKDFFDKIIELK